MARDRDDNILAKAIAEAGDEISFGLRAVAEALKALAAPKADTAKLTLYVKGEPLMGSPVTVQLGLSGGVSNFVESVKATGVIVPAIGPVVYASDTPAVATIDPNTGVWVPVAVGTANLSALDQGNGLTDTVALSVIAAPPPVADTAVLTLVPNATKRR